MIRTLMPRLALLGALLVVLAACGGATTDSTSPTLPSIAEQATAEDAVPRSEATTSTTETVDPDEAMQEYATCMRENGVDMPDPGTDGAIMIGGPDVDPTTVDAAMAECDPILEAAFGDFEMSPEMEAEQRDLDLAFSRCMRDNGVEEWPDPGTDDSMTIELGSDSDPETVNAAVDLCSQQTYGDLDTMNLTAEPSS